MKKIINFGHLPFVLRINKILDLDNLSGSGYHYALYLT